jgi:hypothetical protein
MVKIALTDLGGSVQSGMETAFSNAEYASVAKLF